LHLEIDSSHLRPSGEGGFGRSQECYGAKHRKGAFLARSACIFFAATTTMTATTCPSTALSAQYIGLFAL
jgi:hypothetical protein